MISDLLFSAVMTFIFMFTLSLMSVSEFQSPLNLKDLLVQALAVCYFLISYSSCKLYDYIGNKRNPQC